MIAESMKVPAAAANGDAIDVELLSEVNTAGVEFNTGARRGGDAGGCRGAV